MGYSTQFFGEITIEPALNEHEVAYLNEFASTRRMARGKGAYFVKGTGEFGQGQDPDVIDHNGTGCVTEEYIDNPNYDPKRKFSIDENPVRIRRKIEPICPPEHDTDAEMPGLWCQWVPGDPTALVWDEGEKFYEAAGWMVYLVDNFLRPGAFASTDKGRELVELANETERFSHFTFSHTCNGIIEAQGEEPDDRWRIVVHNNEVTVQRPTVIWPSIPEGITRNL